MEEHTFENQLPENGDFHSAQSFANHEEVTSNNLHDEIKKDIEERFLDDEFWRSFNL